MKRATIITLAAGTVAALGLTAVAATGFAQNAMKGSMGGGMHMGMHGGMMGGGAMAVLGELQGLGLDMGEIQGVTQETISFAKEKGGEDLVNDIVSAIPGLGQFV